MSKLKYYSGIPMGVVIAARPETGSAIAFKESECKWDYAPKDYRQIIADPANFEEITEVEARLVFNDIPPDENLLDSIDRLIKGILM